MIATQTYGARAQLHANDAAKRLLELMERKKTNLCVSVDVTKKAHFLAVIKATAPFVCLVKTHVDIIEDFDDDLIAQLQRLSQEHDFLIFEDRKFADIGNTVKLQYAAGVHRIASWSHITNAHPVPGPSIVRGLSDIGLPLGRGLLLLAEMSTEGTLAAGAYTEAAVRLAREYRDFVIGFIAQRRMEGVGAQIIDPQEDFLILSPGVALDTRGDGLGQQYRTPREVVQEAGADVIIVGRGIYGNGDTVDPEFVRQQATRYREEGWRSYLDRVRA